MKKNWLEWIVFGIGLLLTLALVGYLIYSAVTYKAGTPDITVSYKHDPAERSPCRYLVTVKNHGGETAETVMVKAILYKSGEKYIENHIEFAFVPKHSERTGWVVFQEQAGPSDSISVVIGGYKKP